MKPSKFQAIPEDFIFFDEKVSLDINKLEQSHKGLVQRDVTVKRGGKSFTQKRWIKAGEDEPVPEKKGKKVEATKSVSGLSVGDKFLFLGNKIMTVEKISEKEQTAKMSNGIVYTIEAINEVRKRKEGKAKVEETIDKKPTVKDLKAIDQKPKKLIEKPKGIGIIGSAKDGSLSTKDRKKAIEKMEKFVADLREKEGNIDNNERVSKAANYYTKGNCIEFNRYLLSDKEKVMDWETQGIKSATANDKKDLDKRMEVLDKFLDDAPQTTGTSYRAMWWNPNDPVEKNRFDDFMSNLKIGNVVENKVYSSTTTSKKLMKDFTKMAKSTDIIVEAEYNGTGVYLGNESKEPGQLEVLYKQGIKFKVVDIGYSKNKKNIKIKFEEVK